MPIMPHGDLIGLHFPLPYIDNNLPARLSAWHGCAMPALQAACAAIPECHASLFIYFSRALSAYSSLNLNVERINTLMAAIQ
ncbi:hypothetical protein ACWYXJ_22060 [Janthinobacterium lividum]|uniref:hypothetical protein n=1 Tax=Janthinobacterium sp. BJB446 TaxID=2048009 RepID=UPI001179927A|nr:hypothetical protein [Janthinobacterium sp. BJB446]